MSINSNSINWELHFLIAKFLSSGPCQSASQVLIEELERNQIIPQRTDWLGQSSSQNFSTYSSKFEHIRPEHLLKLVEKLLSTSKNSESKEVNVAKSLLSSKLFRGSLDKNLSFKHPIHPTTLRPTSIKPKALLQRELCGVSLSHNVHEPEFFSRVELQARSLGHLTAVYCVLYDMTGKYIFTGADDHLVKIWSAVDGRLLSTLRGNSAEITDLAVNYENTLLASSTINRFILIWSLSTGAPVATLSGHTSNVTSIFFCPMPAIRSTIRYLASTSTDGSCAFWAYVEHEGKDPEFQPKPTLYLERMRPGHAQMICSSFSPGGMFMAAGSADFNVRVYHMYESDGPRRVLEVQPHTERVDSILWAHRGLRFISGSKDGTALVWRYEFGDSWKYLKINCLKSHPGDPAQEMDAKNRPRVTMIGWTADDSLVLTAISNNLVKVWNPNNGAIVRILRDHRDEVFVIEPHPIYPRVVAIAGHDGQLILWDIGTEGVGGTETGKKIFEYSNTLEEFQGHGAILDTKWSPDGLSLAATDSHGHILMFSTLPNSKFKLLPKELFFHTDYRPLTTDAITQTVLDEQTQVLPHLMPPPFLVNMDGSPYPAQLQRLVPGRENCKEEQLVPNIAVMPGGQEEVIEGVGSRSNIDEMIAQLAGGGGERGGGVNNGGGGGGGVGGGQRGIAHRRSGDIEGVRQSRGNWQSGVLCSSGRRLIVRPLTLPLLKRSEEVRWELGEEEEKIYQERKMRLVSPSDSHLRVAADENEVRQDVRSRRLRLNAAQAAERRRQEALLAQLDEEGIPRPNPPQQEISIPQLSPRRRRIAHMPPPLFGRPNRQAVPNSPNASSPRRRTNATRGGGVRRAPIAYRGDSEPENANGSGGGGGRSGHDSSFSSSDAEESSSSESELSESDEWGGGGGGGGGRSSRLPLPSSSSSANTLTPARKRTTRGGGGGGGSEDKKPTLNSESDEDEDYEDPRPGPSSAVKNPGPKDTPVKARPKRAQRKVVDDSQLLDGISPAYRPSEWFAQLKPKKFPYWPQIGDEVVYFWKGHEKYLEAIQRHKFYDISKYFMRSLPWNLNPNLDDQVSCKVLSVKYEIKPPRLIVLKLGITNWSTGVLTTGHINVTYHDVKDVVDFIILRQMYDKSMRHNWSVNDRFRCLIDDVWWLGTITALKPFCPEFPNSKFLCYKIRWDNDDNETLSPWDIEVIPDAFEVPEDSNMNGVSASEEELRACLYEVSRTDWPPYGHVDAACDLISTKISEVMTLSIAEPFLTPVDLNLYTEYAYHIPYPIDLSTIKARLDSRFYRREEAVKFDIKYIAINTELFNVSRSEIVKKGRIIRDLCLLICSNPNIDINAEYHNLQRNFEWRSEDVDEEERRKRGRAAAAKSSKNESQSQDSAGPSTSSNIKTRLREKSSKHGKEGEGSRPWKERCKELLTKLWQARDGAPFREPVDIVSNPTYYQIIDTPMDLNSIREDLLGGNYSSPLQFSKDVQLIFSNSRQFNTDKHSPIYQMTIRLKSMFDCQIRPIIEDFKKKGKFNQLQSRRTSSRLIHSPPTSAGSTPRKNPIRSAASKNPYVHSNSRNGESGEEMSENDDEEEEDEDDDDESGSENDEPLDDGHNYRDTRRRTKKRRVAKNRRISNGGRRRISNGDGERRESLVRRARRNLNGFSTTTTTALSEGREENTSPVVEEEEEPVAGPSRKISNGSLEASSRRGRKRVKKEETESEFEGSEAEIPFSTNKLNNRSESEEEVAVRRSSRYKRKRLLDDYDENESGTEEESSRPQRRLRGRVSRNYNEELKDEENEESEEEEVNNKSKIKLTLADRVKRRRVTNGSPGESEEAGPSTRSSKKSEESSEHFDEEEEEEEEEEKITSEEDEEEFTPPKYSNLHKKGTGGKKRGRRKKRDDSDEDLTPPKENRNSRMSRGRGKRLIGQQPNYAEESDEEDGGKVTISSRGRICKRKAPED